MTRRSRLALAALGTLALVTAALLYSTRNDQPDHGPEAERPAPAASTRSSGSRDEAVDVAITAATAPQGWLYLSDDEIRHAIDAIATPGSRTRLADAAIDEVTTARDSLRGATGPVWWLVRPLAWRIETLDGERATVSVWVVRILSARDVAAPQSSYATVEIDLEWSPDGWRVDEVDETPGPTPAAAPAEQAWGSHDLDDALDGFTRMGEGAS